MTIPRINYYQPSLRLTKDDMNEINNIFTSGWVSISNNVEKLEEVCRKKFNVKYAIACSCCTQGLIISIKASGWKNKRIAVPAFTWPSTVYAIECTTGNKAVFCDIDISTWQMDLDSIDYDSYDVVLGVDLFGNQLKLNTDKPVIYDAAHGFGLEGLGSRGDAEVVSFSFTKVVSATEGGMILTNNKKIYETAYELRRLSARMEEVNAVVALRSIADYKKSHSKRIDIIQLYNNNLKISYQSQVIPIDTNYSVFAIMLDSKEIRDLVVDVLEENNIEVKVYYEPIIEGLNSTDLLYARIIALPVYSQMKDSIKFICDIINSTVEMYKNNKVQNKTTETKLLQTSVGIPYLNKTGFLSR